MPGDFVTRSTDHVTQVTTIQSPDRSTMPVVGLENWAPPNALTYAVDGFTLTGGSNGIKAWRQRPHRFFHLPKPDHRQRRPGGGPGATMGRRHLGRRA